MAFGRGRPRPPRWQWSTLVEDVRQECSIDPSTGCWVWQKGKDKDGYPKLFIDGKNWRGNRAVLKAVTGKLGSNARHKCDNPPCMNPDHLEWGSSKDNKKDSIERGRHAHGDKHFMRQDPSKLRGEGNGRSKLSNEMVQDIKSRRQSGMKVKDIAVLYGVDRTTISRVINGHSW